MDLVNKIRRLNEIGIALSAETDERCLLETILQGAKELTGSDGGTLYTITPNGTLKFELLVNTSLGLHFGGTSAQPVLIGELPLYQEDGSPNLQMVAAASVLEGHTINIPDVYKVEGYDFTGTRKFDQRNGYRSQSMLTVPIKDHERQIIGVLQLINAMDDRLGICPFTQEDQELVESLASQAGVTMSKQRLLDQLNGMLEGFIGAIADAIDEKSPHTGEHCRRVPLLTMMIAEAMGTFSPKQLKELHIAALLHDCGKVTTPVHIVDKGSRLETLFDRIHYIEAKLEILRRDVEIAFLKGELNKKQHQECLKELDESWTFLNRCNQCEEVVSTDKAARVQELGQRSYVDARGNSRPLLDELEVHNLSIPVGTLNDGERKIIRQHVDTTIHMLENLPYPEHLKNIPMIAGSHHERMDGRGYPLGLSGEEMPLQARILAFADIFEALTAPDRPYKRAYTLSQALGILENLKNEGHVDPYVYKVFMENKLYNQYAIEYLSPIQYDLN